MNLEKFARVNVVGASGSGKTTFARKLAAVLGHPLVEMDQLFWDKNWKNHPDDVFFARIEESLKGDRWIIDGNYDRTWRIKWKSATAVVWLDYSFTRNLFQSVRRAVVRAITREELWPGTGNRESFLRMFSKKDSIILWMIQTHSRIRERYSARAGDPAFKHIHFVRLRSPREAEEFLAKLAASK